MILSAIIPAHDEGEMLGTAVRSVTRAFDGMHVQMSWVSTRAPALELVIVLDRADAATTAVARALRDLPEAHGNSPVVHVKILETDFGEPGSARNAGVWACQGQYVVFLDADDLLGRTFVTKAYYRLLEHDVSNGSAKSNLVLHPELLYYFGEKTLIWRQPTFSEYLEYRDALWRQNLWDVTMITARSVLVEHPFVPSRLEEGTGFEDWEWSLRTSLSGIQHDTVAGCFCYKRTKKVSRYSKDCFHSVLISTERVRTLVTRGTRLRSE